MDHEDTIRRMQETAQALNDAGLDYDERVVFCFLALQMDMRQAQALEKIAAQLVKVNVQLECLVRNVR